MGQTMARLSNSDKVWLANSFPALVVVERPLYSLVEGELQFKRAYNKIVITDSYTIRLQLYADNTKLPRVTETTGRLKKVLAKHSEFKGELVELHIYPDERLCLGAPQDLRLNYLPNPEISLLFEKYMVPYFYSQAFFERNGSWPWRHLPHNSYGILTWYVENSTMPGAAAETISALKSLAGSGNKKAKRIVERAMRYESFSPNSKCMCGSGKRQASCHPALIKLALAFRFPGKVV